MKKIFASTIATALLLSTTVAQAETRPEASRFSEPVAGDTSELGGDTPIWLIILFLAAIAAGVVVIADDDDKENSPF